MYSLCTGARYVREVLPGEIIEMSRHGIRTVDVVERPAERQQAFCIFEYVYFARADSTFEGKWGHLGGRSCHTGRHMSIELKEDGTGCRSLGHSIQRTLRNINQCNSVNVMCARELGDTTHVLFSEVGRCQSDYKSKI